LIDKFFNNFLASLLKENFFIILIEVTKYVTNYFIIIIH